MSLILVEKLKNGQVTQTWLSEVQTLQVNPDASYDVFDSATMKAPKGLILKRKGAALEVEVEQEVAVRMEGFYDEASQAVFSVDGSEVVDASDAASVDAAGGVVDGVVWQASAFSTLVVAGTALGIGGILALTNSSDGDDGNGTVTDSIPPTISAVSIPDSEMKVGDVVIVTITVADDGGDTYSNVSGTVGGFALSNLTRIDSTTYSAQFTVTEGGSDVAAGTDIPVSITLDDSAGNTSAAFTTAISQAGDAIDANSPATPSAPDLDASSDTGVSSTDNITSDTTPTFNGTAEADSTVQVSSSVDGILGTTTADGSGNWSFIAGTLSAGAHNITATVTDAAGNSSVSSALAMTIDSTVAAPSEPDLDASSDSGVSSTDNITSDNTPTFNGTAEANSTVQVSSSLDGVLGMTVTDGSGNWSFTSGALNLGTHDITAIATDVAGNTSSASSALAITIDGNSPTVAITDDTAGTAIGDVTYTFTFSEDVTGFDIGDITVTGGSKGTFTLVSNSVYTLVVTPDVDSTTDITVDVAADVAMDGGGNGNIAATQSVQAVDTAVPVISAVSIPDVAMNVGDAVTVSITASEAGLSMTSGTINGVAVTGFTDIGGGSYSATYTVTEGDADRAAGDDIPVSFVLEDAAGNPSATFTTAISQAGDAIDANSPAAPSAPDLDASSDTGVSDTDNITSDTTPTFNGTAEANSTVQVSSSVDGVLGTTTTDGSGNWSFTSGTLSAGAHDITATATDVAGNTSSVSSALAMTIEASGPSISAVSIPNAAMNVGDAVTVSITASEAGLSLTSGTINGVAVTGFTDIGGGSYSATYTVTEGDADRAAGDDIPVSFVLQDGGGNTSATFTTAISQAADAIDANSPIISAVSIPDVAMNVGDAVSVTITASETGLSLSSGTINGVAVTGFTDIGGGSYSATYTVAEGDTDRVAGDDIPVSFVLQDGGGNTSATFTTAISQAADAIDANSPIISAVSIPDVAMNVGDAVTVSITASEAGLSLSSGIINGVAVTGFTDIGGGSYSATYTVTEGDTDRAAGDDIPVSFVLADAAGNPSATFTTAISQTGDTIDANSPTLSSSTPSDNATSVALDADIVVDFNENIALGSGNIVISDGSDTITIDVASHGGQLSIIGEQLTINPTADLANGSANYNVQIAPTAIVDTAGNAYGGIADTTTLDFTTTAASVDTSIVVFDMTAGTSSNHDGGSGSTRTFSSSVSYDIYIKVDSNSAVASQNSAWSGAANLGSDDTIYLVGNGSTIIGNTGGPLVTSSNAAGSMFWDPIVASLGRSGSFVRYNSGASTFADIYAGGVTIQHGTSVMLGAAATTLPAIIATTQVLS